MHKKVDNDGVEAPSVGGRAGVVARILSLHGTQQQCAVGMDEPVPIHGHGDGRVFTVRSMGYGKQPLTWSLPQMCKKIELGAERGLLGDLGLLGLRVSW